MNPALPLNCFVPDAEAHVMPDGRLYVYGSWDIANNADYCSDMYHVFSTDDMETWTDHGVSYRCGNQILFAPDCAYKEGKYYLYACMPGGREVTAVSSTPYGPFMDTKTLNYADGRGIDPSVFVDDDGQAYYFWGQFSLCGAKLNRDMRSIDETSVVHDILTEEEHGFHEGSSIRKINKRYYLIYTDITRGRATCLAYAISDQPLGPYKRMGVIIDNTYCDPSSWNNHGSIEMFKGQLYVFYHRSSRNSRYSRRLCIEKLNLLPDGSITEAEMTTNGASEPIDAFTYIEAARACRIRCEGYISLDEKVGERITNCSGSSVWNGCVEIKYLDFGTGADGVELEVKGKGVLHIRQKDRSITVDMEVDSMDDFSIVRAAGHFQGGIQPVRIFIESEAMDIRGIRFIKDK